MNIVNAQFQDWKGNVYHFETSADMIKGADESFTPLEHNHDDRYYIEKEIDKMADDLKKCVVDGKEKIANAINDKTNDNQMNKNNTFDELANGIRNIQTGFPINGIIKEYKVKSGEVIKAGDFVNFVNGGTEVFDKPVTELISGNCEVKAVQYNENVILLAWHIIENNLDCLYVCDLKVDGENIVKGNKKLVFSIDKIDEDRNKAYIKNFITFDKVGNSNKVVLIYNIYELTNNKPTNRYGINCAEITYNGSVSFINYMFDNNIEGKAISHITNYFGHDDVFFIITKDTYESKNYFYVVYFKLSNNKLFIVSSAYIELPKDKQYDCMGIKMYGDCKVSLLFKEYNTNNYKYVLDTTNYYSLTENPSFACSRHILSLVLPKTDYVFLATTIVGAESIIIYGNTQLQAKYLRLNKGSSIEITDYDSKITHNKIYGVFDTGIYINTDSSSQYTNTNVGNIIIYYNDNNKNYFAELGIFSGNSIEEQKISNYEDSSLPSTIYLLNHSIHMMSTSNRLFIMNNDNLIVINLSDLYAKPIEIETVLNLSKMKLNTTENQAQIFYLNNRYIIINSKQNTEAFLLNSNSNTGIIESSKSGLEAYNATDEELFAGVAKTSGSGGEYIQVYVSRCRQYQ